MGCAIQRVYSRGVSGNNHVEFVTSHADDPTAGLDQQSVYVKALVNGEWVGICQQA